MSAQLQQWPVSHCSNSSERAHSRKGNTRRSTSRIRKLTELNGNSGEISALDRGVMRNRSVCKEQISGSHRVVAYTSSINHYADAPEKLNECHNYSALDRKLKDIEN